MSRRGSRPLKPIERELVDIGPLNLYSMNNKRRTYHMKFKIILEKGKYLFVGSGILRNQKAFSQSQREILKKGPFEKILSHVNELSLLNEFSFTGNRYTIPGSTIKGAIRSKLELCLSSSISCYSVTGRKAFSRQSWRHINLFKPDRRLGDEAVIPNENEKENIIRGRGKLDRKRVCIVCDSFGTSARSKRLDYRVNGFSWVRIRIPSLMSKFLFSDATLSEGNSNIQVLSIFGRMTRVICGPAVFEFEVVANDALEEELILFMLATGCLEEKEILLGAYKYRTINGKTFGKVKLSLEEINEIKVIDGVPKEFPVDINNLKNKLVRVKENKGWGMLNDSKKPGC